MGLFYSNDSKSDLMDYAYVCYLSDPHNDRSQTEYLFTCGGTMISWQYVKQTITTTLSSNHAEILALHETSLEYVLLRSIIQQVQPTYGLS